MTLFENMVCLFGNSITNKRMVKPVSNQTTHDWLKATLKERGILLTSVAQRLGVRRSSVTNVAKGVDRSHRIETLLLELSGATPEQLWPDRFPKSLEEKET